MANAEFIEFKIDGIAYLLRADFKSVSKIEQEMQTSFIKLTQRLSDENITIAELAEILWHSMDNRAERTFIQSAIISEGLGSAIDAVTRLFAQAWEGSAGAAGSPMAELELLRRRFPD